MNYLTFLGETMRVTSKEFTDNPCALAKREGMVDAARGLLAAVTRLLILADILDVVHLLQHLTAVSKWSKIQLLLAYIVYPVLI